MKRIKSVNGYTIYQAATQRDADNYNCQVGDYSIYLSSDIRDFGLSCSYPEWDGVDSLAVAVAMCKGSSHAVAVELAEELSNSTIQDMDLVLEIERRLDAGEAVNTIRDSYNTWGQYFYDPSVAPYLDVELQDDPNSDRGGIDHLGETVRDFLCDIGRPVDLAGLNNALHECGILPVGDFCSDEEKMRDFRTMSKEAFLESYSYLTEAEYDATTIVAASPDANLDYDPDETDLLVRAMRAADWSYDGLDIAGEICFGGPNCELVHFSSWPEVRKWLEGVVFDDPEVSDRVESILHPERFASKPKTPEIEVGDYLLDSFGGIVRVRATNDTHIAVEYPSGRRGYNWPLAILDLSRIEIVKPSSPRELQESAWSAWSELGGAGNSLF